MARVCLDPISLSTGLPAYRLLLVLALLGTAAPLQAEEGAARWLWQQSPAPGRGAALEALAVAPAGDRVAVGGHDGVAVGWLGPAGEHSPPVSSWQRWPSVGAVRDLVFAPDAALWIASDTGLWRLAPAGRLEDRTPGAGEATRQVLGVHVGAGFVAVASEAGAYLSRDGLSWRRVSEGLPSGPVEALALRPAGEGAPAGAAELWLLCAGSLWRALAVPADAREEGGLALEPAREETIAGRPASEPPVEIRVDLPAAEVVVLYPRALALRGAPGSQGLWELWVPVLPPGAAARSLARAGTSYWLATDHGILEAASLPGPWRRAAGEAAGAPAEAVAGADGLVLAVGSAGLLQARSARLVTGDAAAQPASAVRRTVPLLPADPELGRVREQALAYLGLEAERSADLRARVGRRGWLPVLSVRAAGAYERDTGDELDESFSYGELHALRAGQNARSRDFEAALTLSWDLANLVFDPGSIDFSREERLVIALRDDVLDEINQLYFDRRRVLQALQSFADRSDPEAALLELRAQELAAGLDAWTGGWFSRQLRGAPESRTP